MSKRRNKLARVDLKVQGHSEIVLPNIYFQYYIGSDSISFSLKNMDEDQQSSDGLVKTFSVYLTRTRLNGDQEKQVVDFSKAVAQAESFFNANKKIPYTAAKLYLSRLLNQLPNVHFEQKENNTAPPSKKDVRVQALGPNVKFHVTTTPRAGIENAFDFNFKETTEYLTSLQGNNTNIPALLEFVSDPQNKKKIQNAGIDDVEKLLKRLKVPFSRWTSTYELVHSFDGRSISKKASFEDFVQIIKIAAFIVRKSKEINN